jgi:hypothetical protein
MLSSNLFFRKCKKDPSEREKFVTGNETYLKQKNRKLYGNLKRCIHSSVKKILPEKKKRKEFLGH